MEDKKIEEKPSPTPSPEDTKLMKEIEERLALPRSPEDTRRIMESPEFEENYRRTMGDEAWERRKRILEGLGKVGEKKDE